MKEERKSIRIVFQNVFMKKGVPTTTALILSSLVFFLSFSPIVLPESIEIVSKGNIEGDFEGWQGETVFEISDGTFWIQAAYSYTYHYAYHPEAMVLRQGSYFFLKVNGINEILPVMPLEKVIKSKIDGNFNGFEGNTIYRLLDGSIWQQIDGKYKYKYAYSPRVLVYNFGKTWKMSVKGITVTVVPLK